MKKIFPEPRIKAQHSYTTIADTKIQQLQDQMINDDLFRGIAVEIKKGFADQAIDLEYIPFRGNATAQYRRELELWVFTPESLLDLIDACEDIMDTTSLDLGAQLRRIIHNKSLIKKV